MFRTVPLSIIRSFTCFGQFLCPSSEVLHVLDSSSVHHQEFYMFRTVPLSIIRSFTCFGQLLCPSSGVLHVLDSSSVHHQEFYMFRTVPLSIIRSFPLYTQQLYMSYRFADSLRAGSGRNAKQAKETFQYRNTKIVPS